jgi:hypothetical protein
MHFLILILANSIIPTHSLWDYICLHTITDFKELILIIQNLNEPVEYWQCINQQGYCLL